jgi:hypothetical protein
MAINLFEDLFSLLACGNDNFHSHKCERCGAEWAHSDACRHLPTLEHCAAHTCKCGAEQFTKSRSILSKEQADELNSKN